MLRDWLLMALLLLVGWEDEVVWRPGKDRAVQSALQINGGAVAKSGRGRIVLSPTMVELGERWATALPDWLPCVTDRKHSIRHHKVAFLSCILLPPATLNRRQVGAPTSLLASIGGRGWQWLQERNARFYPLARHQLVSRDLEMPPDPVVPYTDPLFARQWYLWNRDRDRRGHDLNVLPIWRRGFTGKGIVVAIVDDGVYHQHADLQDAFRSDLSYDFNEQTEQPRPRRSRGDFHGTRCAGQIVAKPNNGICGVGIAPGAQISALRTLSGAITNVMEAAAVVHKNQEHHIYTCSWGPADDGKSIDAPSKLVLRAFAEGLAYGRQGRGSLYVFAAGNGKAVDNCNYDGYANGLFALTVGALDVDHRMPPYMEPCPAQLITAYSSNDQFRIATTELGGNRCTTRHGGTSAAAPMVTGVLALILEARPDLGWRDIRHILVESAVRVSDQDHSWVCNGAGRWYSYKFGFGKLDALRAFQTAQNWKAVRPPILCSLPRREVVGGRSINGQTPVVIDELLINAHVLAHSRLHQLEHLEQVSVHLNIEHSCRGDLVIKLTSPAGTTITLATRRPLDRSDAGLRDWTMMTVGFWGEAVSGRWSLQVGNAGHAHSQSEGRLISYRLSFLGSSRGDYDAEEFIASIMDDYYPPSPDLYRDRHGFWEERLGSESPSLDRPSVTKGTRPYGSWVTTATQLLLMSSVALAGCLVLARLWRRRGLLRIPSTEDPCLIIDMHHLQSSKTMGRSAV